MTTKIIRDNTGNPVSVLVDYQDWVEIERLLLHTKREDLGPDNPLDWYTLTETTNSILNELLAHVSREQRKERKKDKSDPRTLTELEALFEEVYSLNDNPENFKSRERMEEIINKYAPKVRAIYEHA